MTFTVSLGSGASFVAEINESFLSASLRAGLTLPHGCGSGRCSACKCKLTSGNSIQLADEIGLSAEDKQDGYILTCIRSPLSNVVLDIEDLSFLRLPRSREFPCKINKIFKLSDSVISVFLRLPPSSDFQYLAGQYIDINLNGVVRSYSIANAQSSDKVIELQIKYYENGVMSDYWFNHAKLNDLLRIKGPMGTFCLRNVYSKHLLFLATGTGIAPIKAILEDLSRYDRNLLPAKISLYWGCRLKSDIYWDPDYLDIDFDFKPVLSREHGSDGYMGYIQDLVVDEVKNFSDVVVYACGSSAMISQSQNVLCKAGLPQSSFYSDAFVASGLS